jgi:hypothetical protein
VAAQQSITYGDYTAQLIERALYDPATKSLNDDPKVITGSLKQEALAAMRANPVLARNVVMLAMRHAIADSLGGPDKADSLLYRQTQYSLARAGFVGKQACGDPTPERRDIEEFLPNWRFQYFVTSEEKQKDSTLNGCPLQYEPDPSSLAPQLPARGAGVGVTIADFYVLVPPPLTLSSGVFEQPDSVRLALAYRDRLNQAIIDRNVAAAVRDVSGSATDKKPQEAAASTAYALLNEGWSWQSRTKSK